MRSVNYSCQSLIKSYNFKLLYAQNGDRSGREVQGGNYLQSIMDSHRFKSWKSPLKNFVFGQMNQKESNLSFPGIRKHLVIV